ncbi:hypothetical protein FB45DRAFT_147455 [Roridomyces roridus]|uniref:Uncharacterized protein n=1 Tax=Roridomyces roridus TaxID=1738132 RepID=A0AAD7BFW8_9AGAR|nr:hypothetical protein FB45DRAFT_147455 [Roridomyces roridus]
MLFKFWSRRNQQNESLVAARSSAYPTPSESQSGYLTPPPPSTAPSAPATPPLFMPAGTVKLMLLQDNPEAYLEIDIALISASCTSTMEYLHYCVYTVLGLAPVSIAERVLIEGEPRELVVEKGKDVTPEPGQIFIVFHPDVVSGATRPALVDQRWVFTNRGLRPRTSSSRKEVTQVEGVNSYTAHEVVPIMLFKDDEGIDRPVLDAQEAQSQVSVDVVNARAMQDGNLMVY